MSDPKEAKKAALRILARYDRTEAELKRKLLQKGFSGEDAEYACEEMKNLGYLNDLAYAVHYLDYQRESKSLRRILHELREKGISSEISDAALQSAAPFDEKPLIKKLAGKRLPWDGEATPEDLEKCKAYLYRQGFRMADILDVLSKCDLT